jgi:hypothetical protein
LERSLFPRAQDAKVEHLIKPKTGFGTALVEFGGTVDIALWATRTKSPTPLLTPTTPRGESSPRAEVKL